MLFSLFYSRAWRYCTRRAVSCPRLSSAELSVTINTMNKSRQRSLIIGIGSVLGVLILVGAAFALSRSGNKGTQPTPAAMLPPEKVNTIPVEERPYAHITPSANGRNITLAVGAIKKAAAKGEYEIEYTYKNGIQGAFGKLDVAKLPAEYDVLLGSCSAGGKCSYDEEVTTGSIKLRFDTPEKYVLKNDWLYIDNTAKEDTWSSNDAKLVITGTGLPAVAYAVILQAPGWAGELPATPVSPIYAVGTSTAVRGNVTVGMRVPVGTDASTVDAYSWNGTSWTVVASTASVDDAQILEIAAKPLAEAYTLVPKQ